MFPFTYLCERVQMRRVRYDVVDDVNLMKSKLTKKALPFNGFNLNSNRICAQRATGYVNGVCRLPKQQHIRILTKSGICAGGGSGSERLISVDESFQLRQRAPHKIFRTRG